MLRQFRVKCACGEVTNAAPGQTCPKCNQPLNFPEDAIIYLYRKGSPLGIAGGFGIYLDGAPIGYIGNRELIGIPVTYGEHTIHVAAGMNRKCNDMRINLTPQTRAAYLKVWMRPGFWTNSFVLEPATAEEMPFQG